MEFNFNVIINIHRKNIPTYEYLILVDIGFNELFQFVKVIYKGS